MRRARGLGEEVEMHRAIWAVKRAHWRCWAGGRRMLRKAGITPGRLDVLHALWSRGGSLGQRALQEALGVVRSTVSEALAKMEELGLVTRGRRRRFGRSVTVTPAGKRALDGAYLAQWHVDNRLEKALGAFMMTFMGRIVVLERICRRLRVAFGDESVGALYDWYGGEDD